MEASKVFENVYSGKIIKNCTKDNEHQEYIFNVYVLFGFLKLFLKYYNDCFNCITGWKKLIVSNLYSQKQAICLEEKTEPEALSPLHDESFSKIAVQAVCASSSNR